VSECASRMANHHVATVPESFGRAPIEVCAPHCASAAHATRHDTSFQSRRIERACNGGKGGRGGRRERQFESWAGSSGRGSCGCGCGLCGLCVDLTQRLCVWERDAFAVERYALAAALDAKRETQAMERDALLTKHQRAAAEAQRTPPPPRRRSPNRPLERNLGRLRHEAVLVLDVGPNLGVLGLDFAFALIDLALYGTWMQARGPSDPWDKDEVWTRWGRGNAHLLAARALLDVIADGPLVSEAAHQAVRATDEADTSQTAPSLHRTLAPWASEPVRR
jgi:hypothetical protein